MKRPLVLMALFYIAGILLGRSLITLSIVPFVVFLLLSLLCTGVIYYKGGTYQWFLILPLLFVGIFNAGFYRDNFFNALSGRPLHIQGIVTEITNTEYGAQYLTLEKPEIRFGSTLLTPNKKISVFLKKPRIVLCGQEVTVWGIGERFDFQRNPGGWDESSYMMTRGYCGKLDASGLSPGEMKKPAYNWIHTFVQSTSDALNQVLSPDTAPLMRAVVLGDKADISEESYEAFKQTGVSHLFAISGLHLSIISMIIFYLLGQAGLGLCSRSAGTILLAIAYCILTGSSVSTVRAVIMVSVALSGNILGRSSDAYTSVALAALLLLLKNPLFLWDAGFLLSFSAVLGILSLSSPLQRRISNYLPVPEKALGYLSSTLAATIITLPITAYFFGGFSLIGILANLLLLPFAGVLVGSGLLFTFVQGFSVSVLASSVMFSILRYYLAATAALNRIPLGYITTAQPEIAPIIIYYVILLLFLLYDRRDSLHNIRFRLTLAALTLVMLAYPLPKRVQTSRQAILAFLDVGQGDCSILHLPGNKHIMIDGGGKATAKIGENTGKRIVYPYLSNQGISELNAIFLTHPDMDHAAGVIEIMDLVKVHRLFISDCGFDDEVQTLVLDAAERNNVPISRIHSGYSAAIGDALLECLYPFPDANPESANNGSLVMKFTYEGQSILITGDIERLDEKILADSGRSLSSNILKVPHHGSATSSSQLFLDAVSPKWAVVGSGKDNSFGHPAPEVSQRYEQMSTPLYNTAEEGAIFITFTQEQILINTMKDKELGNAKATSKH